MSDESNREDGEQDDIFRDETEGSNQKQGDENDDATSEAEALTAFNKRVGKNYKSWDEVSKREKTIDEFYAKGGQQKEMPKKEEKAEAPTSNVIKNLFFKANPEAEEVWDEVEKAAKLTARDPFDLYTSESFLQEKAKAKLEARKAEEEAKSKIADPASGGKPYSQKDFSKLTDEQVLDLPPEQYEKYSQWRKGQSTTGGFIFDK